MKILQRMMAWVFGILCLLTLFPCLATGLSSMANRYPEETWTRLARFLCFFFAATVTGVLATILSTVADRKKQKDADIPTVEPVEDDPPIELQLCFDLPYPKAQFLEYSEAVEQFRKSKANLLEATRCSPLLLSAVAACLKDAPKRQTLESLLFMKFQVSAAAHAELSYYRTILLAWNSSVVSMFAAWEDCGRVCPPGFGPPGCEIANLG